MVLHLTRASPLSALKIKPVDVEEEEAVMSCLKPVSPERSETGQLKSWMYGGLAAAAEDGICGRE